MKRFKTSVVKWEIRLLNKNVLLFVCATICVCSAVYTPSEVSTKPPLRFDKNLNIHDAVKTASIRRPAADEIERGGGGVIMHHNYSRIGRQRTVVDAEPPTNRTADDRDESLHAAASSDRRAYSRGRETSVRDENARTNDDVVIGHSGPESFLSCPTNATGAYPYALDCKRFLNCWKGRGHIQNCGPGTLFNPRTYECDFPDKVQCTAYIAQAEAFDADGNRTTTTTTNRRGKNVRASYRHDHDTRRTDHLQGFVSAESTFSASYRSADSRDDEIVTKCPDDFVGLLPDASDCTKFWNCNDGRNYRQECGPGTVFNPNVNACDFENNYPCDSKADEESGTEPPESHVVDRRFDKEVDGVKRSARPACPEDANGPTAHPYDCSKFLNCDRGRTFVQDCGPGTLFDPIIRTCDHAHKVKCNVGHKDAVHSVKTTTGHRNVNYAGVQATRYPDSQRVHDNFNSYAQQSSSNVHSTPRYPSYGFIKPSTDETPRTRDHFTSPETAASDISEVSLVYRGQESRSFSPQSRTDTGSRTTTRPPQRATVVANENVFNSRPIVNVPSVTIETAGSNRQSTVYPPRRGPGGHYIIRENDHRDDVNDDDREIAANERRPPSYTHEIGFKRDIYPAYTTPYAILASSQNSGTVSKNVYRDREESQIQQTASNNFHSDIRYVNNPSPTTHRTTPSSRHVYIFPGQRTEQNGHTSSTLRPVYIHREAEKSAPVPQNTYRDYEETHKRQEVQVERENLNPNRDRTRDSDSNFDRTHRTDTTTIQRVHGSRSDTARPPVSARRQSERDDLEAAGSGGAHVDFPYRTRSSERVTTVAATTPTTTTKQTHASTTTKDASPTETHDRTPFEQTNFKYPYPFYAPQTADEQEVDDDDIPEGDFGVYGSYKDILPTMRTTSYRTFEEPDYEILSQDSLTPLEIETLDQKIENLTAKNTSRPFKNCTKEQFRCDAHNCIPLNYVCDGKHQCSDSKDEANCTENLDFFTKHKESKLEAHGVEKWMNIKLETCAQYCLQSKSFQCMSFNYDHEKNDCMLSDSNVGHSGRLYYSKPYDYYELKAYSVNCDGKFQCDNLKCLDKSKVCDSVDDCGDRSDERQICRTDDINYAIRLAGSDKTNEGRLEVRVYGQWGFICDDQFGIRDANVACRELGFAHGAVQVKGNSHFYVAGNEINEDIENKTIIMMDDVTCFGNESSLRDCSFNGWGMHDCSPQEIVGVVCKTPTQTCPQNYWMCSTKNECIPLPFLCDIVTDCDDGSDESDEFCKAPLEVRLVNGPTKSQGRVEVRHNGVWGTICDDDFSERAAKVVCSQLGYNGSAIVKKEGVFGPGSGPIWLDRVICIGNERTIENCHHDDWGQHNCGHDEDVGVICGIGPNVVQKPKLPKKTLSTVNMLPVKCGYRDEDTFDTNTGVAFRVVAGSLAQKGHYPWQVSLRVRSLSKSSHWCGGVIISQHHILTAAHCLTGFSKGSYFIRAGDYDVDIDEDTEAEAYVEDFYIHEEFRKGHHMNNDIALIKLKSNGLPLGKHIRPICLPDSRTVYTPGTNCTISGWGSTKSGKSTASRQLRAGWVPLQSPDICRMKEVYGNAIMDGMICAGSLDEGVDACDGDSGGPLACMEKGLFTLYGITSWGQHCGYANKPGVYVKIAYYRNWIDEKVRKSMLES